MYGQTALERTVSNLHAPQTVSEVRIPGGEHHTKSDIPCTTIDEI